MPVCQSPVEVLAALADHILAKRCDERRRYRTCGCGCRSRKVNPCAEADRLAAGAEAMACGQPTDVTEPELRKFVARKRCHNPMCNHLACIRGDELLERWNSGE